VIAPNLDFTLSSIPFNDSPSLGLHLLAYPTSFSDSPRGGSRILVWERHWQEVCPSGVQGQRPGGDFALRRMLRHEAEKNTYEEEKQVHTD